MTKKANSMVLLEEAVDGLGFAMTSIDLRRLHVFTRDCITRPAVTRLLRQAVAQFRLDPLKLLEQRGVGLKTLHSVQLLHELLLASETTKSYGIEDNLQAVERILQTTRRGVPEDVQDQLTVAKNHIHHARNLQEFGKLHIEEVEEGVQQKFSTTMCLVGDSVDIVRMGEATIVSSDDLAQVVREGIRELDVMIEKFHLRLRPYHYIGRFLDKDSEQSNSGAYLRITVFCEILGEKK